MKREDVQSILIIGIAGGLAESTYRMLEKEYPDAMIYGVDSRNKKFVAKKKSFIFLKMQYTRNNFEELFRNNRFDVVYHLGRIPNNVLNPLSDHNKRAKFYVVGTNIILDLCQKFGTKKVIVLSTLYVYGSLPDNPVFLNEDSILRASLKYPEIREVVEKDRLATNWMWKNQNSISTIILRPCHIIGKNINNAFVQYLKAEHMPVPMDYNPMIQFIDQEDMGRVLVSCIEKIPLGIYNVAPDDFISIGEAKSILGIKPVRIPFFILLPFTGIARRLGYLVPDYLIDHLKYSTLLENNSLKKYIGEVFFKFNVRSALKNLIS